MSYFPSASCNGIFENIATCAIYIYIYIYIYTVYEGARHIIFILLIIYCHFQQCKNVQDRLTSDEIIAKIRHRVFWDTVYIKSYVFVCWLCEE